MDLNFALLDLFSFFLALILAVVEFGPFFPNKVVETAYFPCLSSLLAILNYVAGACSFTWSLFDFEDLSFGDKQATE